MKGIYVIAITFLASWAVCAAYRLEQSVSEEDTYLDILRVCPYPEQFPRNTTTNLPHESDCTKYYKCHVGEGVVQDCPLMIDGDPITRLHYNRRLQVCDWPWQAGCSSCPQRYRNGTYPLPSRISYPADNCQFYECVNGQPSLRTCPTGTCFSRTCQDCVVNRSGGYCGSGPGPIPTTTTQRIGCLNNDKRAHECDCGKYYTCYNLDWFLTECGGGQHFSPTTKTCLPPNEAGCLV